MNRNLQRILLVPHDGKPPRTVTRPPGNVYSPGFGPQSDVLVTGNSGASLQLWSLPDLREVRRIEMGGVGSLGYFKGGSLYTRTRMAQGDRHRLFRSWSLPGGEAKTLGTVDLDGITDWRIDPTGRSLAYPSAHSVYLLPGTYQVWIVRPKMLQELGFHTTSDTILFSPTTPHIE